MPIVLAGTIAVTAGLTGPVAHAEPRHDDADANNKRHVDQDRVVTDRPVFGTAVARPSQTVVRTVAATTKAPTTYTVHHGDTVSGIAARFGLSAQEILVRNGLGWNTIIHPGQTLHLASTPAVTTAAVRTSTSTTGSGSATSSYHVKQGDTVSGIASRVGVSTTALLSANKLSQRSVIYPGQTLRVPHGSSSSTPSVSTASAPSTKSSVKISAGDTVASIAAAHHVSVRSLLSANGLSYTSTIYAGKTLVIPSSSTAAPAVSTSAHVSGAVGLSAEQRQNAATIVAVGRSLGVPDRGIVVALAAAMQESSLRNLPHGDRDSVGLFQQRPSQGWGSAAKLQDPAHATALFFGGRHNPNAGTTRGLLDVPGWSSMSITDAAQAVQLSAYPKAYANWASAAEGWLATL
ncbi:LysM peptidoglycan-binding domain-containing protein [Curtobacterium flaccumfaciens pv. flaccumfaciens]|uniref:LysM peptidoglycan-binding domain-containing protein n=2 Tax=Curtobacterium aurantiacum TaxID=3236919 RepID=A0ABS5VGC7_9MICO|nr:LysM peptidoglycan-binding domain-containing protein [Curtobacterium flaccumfaciens pv. flaccumfaciens]MBT1588528.1 LysM peptidoglycan-binding domain-containing protein [Curtobacterium flaccumfaciens pv. flaccumfaciens]